MSPEMCPVLIILDELRAKLEASPEANAQLSVPVACTRCGEYKIASATKSSVNGPQSSHISTSIEPPCTYR